MRRPSVFVTAFVLAVFSMAAPALAQDPPPPTTPQAEAADKKEAPTYVGKWTISTQSPQGAMVSTLDIALDKEDPTQVTGSIASEMGNFEIWGEIEENTLYFAISPDGSMELWFTGKLKEDGTMAGTLDFQGTSMAWTATRVKKG